MRMKLGIALLLCGMAAAAERAPATGPLKAAAGNPRWFVDPSGKAVLLAGSHTWQNLQDNGLLRPTAPQTPEVFDYEGYLGTLEKHNHNFFRLWRWETTRWMDKYSGLVQSCRPHPWLRTGPGKAADGEPRFDLTRFDPEYFRRLRGRIEAARDRGMYVSVMLFEGWEIQFTDAWAAHPFHGPNNVNGIEGDRNGDGVALEYNTLDPSPMGQKVLEAQKAYVRQVVDTVNGLDNVLFEIANEAHAGSTDWQFYLIRYIKEYESAKPRQHPVGMTFQYRGGSNNTLYNSPADWISPNPGSAQEAYIENPCADCTTKVVVSDTDHLWGHTGGDNVWVWRSFTRGLNVLFMEEMLPSPTWQDSARAGMGQARRYAARVGLAAMTPNGKLSGTQYCLANPGKEYLVLQPGWKGEFTLDLRDASGEFAVEWLDLNRDQTTAAPPVPGGATRSFRTPFPGPAVLYLVKR